MFSKEGRFLLIFPAAASPARNNLHAKKPSQGSSRRMVDDDDDDSEVEMLSISSGDEDSTSKEHHRGVSMGGSRGRAGTSVRVGGAGKDDDYVWDGDEPDCWKRVDEAELARRVRDIWESRTAPVAQKFEKKVSVIGRKGLTNLDEGIIDKKSLRLITDASESSPSKNDKDYLDNNLHEKLLYFSEKFDAKLFLARIHQETSSADLETGALALKSDLKGQTQ